MARLRRVKRLVTAAGTFAFALSIGYVMQYGDAAASRVMGQSATSSRIVLPAQLDASPLKALEQHVPKLVTPVVQRQGDPAEDTLRVDPSSVKLTALVADAAALRPDEMAPVDKVLNLPDCPINTSVAVADKAEMLLTLQSPCRANAGFEVQHDGMVFTAATDAEGRASLTVPALQANAAVFVAFDDGAGATVSAVVPEAETLNRVVVQWDTVMADMLQPAGVEAGSLGTLTRLGARTSHASSFAEVFTFPADLDTADGLQGLNVQVPVSDATCGQAIKGQAFHVAAGVAAEPKDFQITLPGCEHAGSFLQLKKILGGQTLLQE